MILLKVKFQKFAKPKNKYGANAINKFEVGRLNDKEILNKPRDTQA